MRKYRKFTPEFRAEAVRQALASDRPTSEVARELQLRPDQLRQERDFLKKAAAFFANGSR